jgi:hypothetical protein
MAKGLKSESSKIEVLQKEVSWMGFHSCHALICHSEPWTQQLAGHLPGERHGTNHLKDTFPTEHRGPE